LNDFGVVVSLDVGLAAWVALPRNRQEKPSPLDLLYRVTTR